MSGECRHGMDPAWCGDCRHPKAPRQAYAAKTFGHGGETKSDVFGRICRLLGVEAVGVGVGSSLPAHVFEELALRIGVSYGSMPNVAEQVVRRANLEWTDECDSRGSVSGGGSTVTKTGLDQLERALLKLLV